MLFKTPGFTAIALLVFAVGIGAATAIVSVADALFMRPLPVPQPERVMTIWQDNRETGDGPARRRARQRARLAGARPIVRDGGGGRAVHASI